ncbi:MAG: hypothetical protein Q9199_004586 [Rusavskia elegans]
MESPRSSTAETSQATISVVWSPRASIAETSHSKSGGSDIEVSSPIYKAKPTCLLLKPGESWTVMITSMTSKRFRWSEEDYEFGLDFGFYVQYSSFSITSGENEVHTLDGSHGSMPFVAIAVICDRPRIRLIPVTRDFNLQSEVYDIELADISRGERMVRELVKMGCTVIQRPEG